MDIVTAQIIREYFETVAEEISKTMESTALSNVFNEAHDYSAGIFYYDGQNISLVARALAVPVHIYACLSSAEAILKFFKNDLYDGDIFLVSDPYFGGSHIPDWTVMKPVFYKNKPVFFPSLRAHMLEVGGPVAGGYNSDAREVWQEGFRASPLKLFEKGERRRDVWDMLMANNRIPDITDGDLSAMIGACRVGERRIKALVEKYGFETVLECVSYILDYSERRMRAEIAKWPDGEYEGESILDHDFAGTRDVKVKVKMTVKGDEAVVDFTGSAPQTPGFVNSRPGNTASYVYTAFAAAFPDIPINSGFFRPVKITMPEGTVVNAKEPAAVGNSTICIGADIGEATMKALEKVAPEKVATNVYDLVIFITIGNDKRYNQLFISIDYVPGPTACGGAYGTDGWGGIPATFCALKVQPLEMNELQFPFLYLQAEYGIDTAAPGRWRGVPAWWCRRKNWLDLEGPGICNFLVQGARHTLLGYLGGKNGTRSYIVLDHGGSKEQVVDEVIFMYPSGPGEVMFSQKSGGGGWGDPLDRDPHMVLDDVLDEYVSLEGARRDYGVVIDGATMAIDRDATERLRETLRRAGKPQAEPSGARSEEGSQ